jgi:hypothetical protein
MIGGGVFLIKIDFFQPSLATANGQLHEFCLRSRAARATPYILFGVRKKV